MAVKKLKMMQFVAPLEDLNEAVISLFHTGEIELQDAEKMLETYSFNIPMSEATLQKAVDVATTTDFEKDTSADDRRQQILSYLNKTEAQMGSPFHHALSTVVPTADQEALFRHISETDQAIHTLKEKKKALQNASELLRLMNANDVEIDSLDQLENFTAAFGTLTSIGRRAIRAGYEEIPAAVLHLGTKDKEEFYLMVYPNKVETEIQRLEETLNWRKLNPAFPKGLSNVEAIAQVDEDLRRVEQEIEEKEHEKTLSIENQEGALEQLYDALALDVTVQQAKAYLAKGKKYFYLAGWISADDEEKFRKVAKTVEDSFVQFLDQDRVAQKAPTLLENPRLFRPFEAMVHMYGTPNYGELDPTGFFAITYVILFGAMFGDLGQGAVFAVLGLLLQKMRHPNLGGVVLRMGIGSMIFGALYGSFFGLEEVIPALLIRPFENITLVLIAAIVFGIGLSTIAYLMGITNKVRMHEYEEAYFGKEGVAGLGLYLSMILLVVNMAVKPLVPNAILVILIVLFLAGILFSQPLANMIFGKRPLYNQAVGDYYVESGFALLETVISVFSGALSFIRVGAFAVNHVGLFLAFQTLGEMMGGAGNIVMLVIGNIVIIGLEGLIVFIQSLRLEYYELFGKYYLGDGVRFTDTKRTLIRR